MSYFSTAVNYKYNPFKNMAMWDLYINHCLFVILIYSSLCCLVHGIAKKLPWLKNIAFICVNDVLILYAFVIISVIGVCVRSYCSM